MPPLPPSSRSPRSLVAGIALFVLLGTPLVAYIWETLNELLAGIVDPLQLLGLLPAAGFFYLLLRTMSRVVESWQTGSGTDLSGTSRRA